MPFGDGTGPYANGKPGRGLGYCNGNNAPGYKMGGGRGRFRGQGRNRFPGNGPFSDLPPYMRPCRTINVSDEEILKMEKEFLEKRLKTIDKSLSGLKDKIKKDEKD
jgi:hypothetical protein